MRGRLHLGTSGYVYPHWRRRFYPAGLPPRDWLPFYARHFATVELNNSFYRLPSKAAFRAWRAQVPDDFVFAVKASRFLTHLKRLKTPAPPLDRLLRRVRPLGPALGPILFQLPAQFHANLPRLAGFLRALERQRLLPGVRAALEVRDASWLVDETYDRLRKANVALCFHDARMQPVIEPVTADFVYVRRHGTAPATAAPIRTPCSTPTRSGSPAGLTRVWMSTCTSTTMAAAPQCVTRCASAP
jgi:uncharacterized protein YecE (DUF72 family)